MKLSQLLTADLIRIGLGHADKKGIVEELVAILAEAGKIRNSAAVIEATMEREAKGSTGLERGVAAPHCKTAAVTELLCSMAISREGIDFDAADGKPSYIFIFLAAPPGMSGPHVQALANIAALSQNEEFLRALREAPNPEKALAIVRDEEMLSD